MESHSCLKPVTKISSKICPSDVSTKEENPVSLSHKDVETTSNINVDAVKVNKNDFADEIDATMERTCPLPFADGGLKMVRFSDIITVFKFRRETKGSKCYFLRKKSIHLSCFWTKN